MAYTIEIKEKCTCGGDGIVDDYDANSNVIGHHSCPHCSGTGFVATNLFMDDTAVEEIRDKVKKIKKTIDDIWDKVK